MNFIEKKLFTYWSQEHTRDNPVLSWLSKVYMKVSRNKRENDTQKLNQQLHQLQQNGQLLNRAPIVIVGNIHMGGVGKTPLCITLIEELQNKNKKPALISRGYLREEKENVLTKYQYDPKQIGDEPALIGIRTQIPVSVGAKRFQVYQDLLKSYPETNIVISDDGLQHYSMPHDFEIGVFPYLDDETTPGIYGSLKPLPLGPLREPMERLLEVDALVINHGFSPELFTQSYNTIESGESLESLSAYKEEILKANLKVPTIIQKLQIDEKKIFHSYIENIQFFTLDSTQTFDIGALHNKKVHLACAIGKPQNFFELMKNFKLDIISTYSAPDHHPLKINDFPQEAQYIIVTEKDAVKLLHHTYSHPDAQTWLHKIIYVSLQSRTYPSLSDYILKNLPNVHQDKHDDLNDPNDKLQDKQEDE